MKNEEKFKIKKDEKLKFAYATVIFSKKENSTYSLFY